MFKPKSSILFLSLIVLLTLGLIFVGCDEVEEEIEEDLNGEAKDEDVIDEDAIDRFIRFLEKDKSGKINFMEFLQ